MMEAAYMSMILSNSKHLVKGPAEELRERRCSLTGALR